MNEARMAQMEQNLHMGLKCLALVMEDLEIATRPGVPLHEQEIARNRVRELLVTLKSLG